MGGKMGCNLSQLDSKEDFRASKKFLFGYIASMSKPRLTSFVTPHQLHALSIQLAEWADRLDQAATVADKQNPPGLAIYNWASVAKGLQLLGSFVDKSEQSKLQATLGDPLSVGQPRPRSISQQVAESNSEYNE
jgi:hypothetical protein